MLGMISFGYMGGHQRLFVKERLMELLYQIDRLLSIAGNQSLQFGDGTRATRLRAIRRP